MHALSSKLAKRRAVLGQIRSMRDAWLFAQILCFAATTPLLVRRPLLKLQALLAVFPESGRPTSVAVDQIITYTYGAFVVGYPLLRANCLNRSLTLYYFLNRVGCDVRLCFGVASLEEGAIGHCWLIHDDQLFLEPQDPRPFFTEMYCLSQPYVASVSSKPGSHF